MVGLVCQATVSPVGLTMCLCEYMIMLLSKMMDYAIRSLVHNLVKICCKYMLLWIMIFYVDMSISIV